jgi:hypothetical protein
MIDNAKIAALMLKQYGSIISDEECKTIQGLVEPKELMSAILRLGAPFNKHEVRVIASTIGDMDDNHSFEKDGDLWRDDVLDKYAQHIYNYEYTYNDEALKVDPSIDTEEKHIGPMAQDIEKVNEACVNEDPKSGYKTVDTGRLALMNAGAIAELARELKELKSAVA